MSDNVALLQILEELETTLVDYDGRKSIAYRRGRVPVLIAAQHGTRHWRGAWMPEEEYTAAMAMYVARASGAHLLCATGRHNDPNYYANSEFRAALDHAMRSGGHIRLLVDLHGTGPNTPCGIALDTRRCPGCEAQVLSVFADAGWRRDGHGRLHRLYVGDDTPEVCGTHRDADGSLVRYVGEKFGVEAVLVAANAHCLVAQRREDAAAYKKEGPFRGDPVLIASLAAALVRLVLEVAG